jgi:hypothetical protein
MPQFRRSQLPAYVQEKRSDPAFSRVHAQVITGQPCCWRPAADWWCVGVTLFYLLTGALPFSDENEKEPDPKHQRL